MGHRVQVGNDRLLARLAGELQRARVRVVAFRAGETRRERRGLARRQFAQQHRERGIELRAQVAGGRRLRAGHHHGDFAAREIGIAARLPGERGQRAAIHGLENLGQFARHGRAARGTERRAHVLEAFGDAMRGLEEHQRACFRREFREPCTAFGEARGQESLEGESLGGSDSSDLAGFQP